MKTKRDYVLLIEDLRGEAFFMKNKKSKVKMLLENAASTIEELLRVFYKKEIKKAKCNKGAST